MEGLERPWENLGREKIEIIVKENLITVDKKFGEIAAIFVNNGYYLRRQRDEEMYVAAGYSTFEEYVNSVYGRSRSWAKRMIQINEKFSEGGNSPQIDTNFVSYSVSQLQEMLYLNDKQLEQVTPEMTVKEIREIKKTEEKITPIERGCITGKSPRGNCVCCGVGGVECCAECQEDCNSRCGWIEVKQEETVKEPCATSHTEEIKDEAWFVKEYIRRADISEVKRLVQICKENKTDGDKAKAIQKYLSPYGASYFGSNEFSYSLHNFQGGIDFDADKRTVKMHMKYGRFVKELLKLPEFANIEAIEQKEIVPKVETPKENVCATSHKEEDGCPPNQSSCTRENWGTSKEEQEAGAEECKKCWNNYKKNQQILNQTATEEPEETGDIQQTEEGVVLEGEYREVEEEKFEETSEKSDIQILKELLEKENRMLRLMQQEFTDNDIRVRKAKITVGALASMLSDMELIMEEELEEVKEQPVLPRLKNNEERKKFIENYQTWPVWFEVPEASEVYHRYDLPDGSSLVICEYCWYSAWQKKSVASTREYLLKPKYKYLQDCKSCQSELIEHLKNVQKGERQC